MTLGPGWQSGDPACWRWKVPTGAALERLQREWITESTPDPEARLRWIVMAEMHKDRCAICGRRCSQLRKDHDHATGLVRGWLCPSCNTSEGCCQGGENIFSRYRERNPATICGVRVVYADPVTGFAAEPEPVLTPEEQERRDDAARAALEEAFAARGWLAAEPAA